MGTTFRTVICTLENMTPDHIRILDGRFLAPEWSVHRPTKTAEELQASRIAGHTKLMMKIMVFRDGLTYIAESQHDAAEYLGRKQPIISMALSRGNRVRSYVDGEWYNVSKWEE